MTRESCILIDSIKIRDDYSGFVHNIGIEVCVESDKTNPAHLVS